MAAGGGHEPNLTPFIDLFSVLICFLLMTAAWTQLESFQVQVEQKPKLNPDLTSETPPPEKEEKKKVSLSLLLKGNAILARQDERSREFMIRGQSIATPELRTQLEAWKNQFGNEQALVIHTEGEATYGQLVQLYDFVNYIGWSQVTINPY